MIEIRAGRRARRQIERHGLVPADIACIPAAAGGPKGLTLLPFDRMLAREWLHAMPSVELVGASIGAWRMAALAQQDSCSSLDRLQHAYVFEQRYSHRPSRNEVAERCRNIVRYVLGGQSLAPRSGLSLSIVAAHARGALHERESAVAFIRAGVANALSRRRLARYLDRVVFVAGQSALFASPFDAFGVIRCALEAGNQEDALLASGTIPLVAAPVRAIAGAPAGYYWDGALIDYHLVLPYGRLNEVSSSQRPRIVLYPHFETQLTAGWLDKHLSWRRQRAGHAWLEDVVLMSPSPALIAKLPNAALPSRQDFYRYGSDHASRERAWMRAISEFERFAAAAFEWLLRPDPSRVLDL